MITLYRLDTPDACRIVWLLEELQLAYQIASPTEPIQHTLSEICTQPSLKEGDHVIVGNTAITEYLLNKYDRKGLRPPMTSDAYSRYQQWIGLIETVLLPLLQCCSYAERVANSRVPFFARSILKKTAQNVLSHSTLKNITPILQHIEENLGQNSWICDSYFSAADIQLTHALEQARLHGILQEVDFPYCFAFLKTISERPSYQIAQDKIMSLPKNSSIEEKVLEEAQENDSTEVES